MMKKIAAICLAILFVAACSKGPDGGASGRLECDTDSVAYVIGMNIGWNLMQMDSTINVAAVCEGVRDVFRSRERLSKEEAETFYLRYMNFVLPEKARAYEEQFLADWAASKRLARTRTGITYEVKVLGDQERIPASERDSLTLRLRVCSTDEHELYSSYERNDSLYVLLSDLKPGLQESVKLIGEGGKILAWIPSHEAYGSEGSEEYGIDPNTIVGFEIELVELDKFADWNRRKGRR